MFYPGRAWGEEFVYPKVKAAEIAKASSEPVLSMPSTMEKEAAKPEASQVITELEKAPVTAVQPTGEEIETAQLVTLPAEVPIARNEPPRELPKTASLLPFIALLGLLATSGGLTLRLAEKRLR
jgi:hypothetical protein